ncbi:hypothetical protein [Saccharopolyspora spinosa]|uniref:Uncharacterized protein n=1 Tax=Saccharopolyspora spinosa TaxID=60894 RepID=A0A2N3Y710_SACSN|nr:hypothetical protein [Saccharopolyspora spinosa]PKW18726.1 hypothetical protein A8926_6851 [Saccharopolyspora spinosa]
MEHLPFIATLQPSSARLRRATKSGHCCSSWKAQGTAGLECIHGFPLLQRDVRAAERRAKRIPVPEAAEREPSECV